MKKPDTTNTTPFEVNESKDERAFGIIVMNALWVLPLTFGAISYGFFNFGKVTPSDIGQVGDYFGGWMTPLLLSFIMLLLIYSLRFQIHQLKQIRVQINQSSKLQEKAAVSQNQLLTQSQAHFELETNANGLNTLISHTESLLNKKANLYVDIIKFDEKLPMDTRLYNLVDGWKSEFEQNADKVLELKFRDDKDAKVVSKYLHAIHNIIYVCQYLVKNKGWVYLSPYLHTIEELIDITVTLHKVHLVEEEDIWSIKEAMNNLHQKMSHIHNDGVVLGDEIIAKITLEHFKEILFLIPTPDKFQYQSSN